MKTDDISMTPYSFYKLPLEEQIKLVSPRLVNDFEFYKHSMADRKKLLLAMDPTWDDLEEKLLKIGGKSVCYQYDPHVIDLVQRGKKYGGRSILDEMQASNCHGNVSELWIEHGVESLSIITGWALTKDNVWRQHSWALWRHDSSLIETTMKRSKYFGFVLSDAEALAFVLMNDREYAESFPDYVKDLHESEEELYPYEIEGLKIVEQRLKAAIK